MDEAFYAENGGHFHSQYPQNPKDCRDLLLKSSTITYLNHDIETIRLSKADGPQTEFKVFGSPFSPAKGSWAFQYSAERSQALWDQIPLDTDILITHTPPKLHCDESKEGEPAGCGTLKEALWRVRPLLSVCGHVHEARGAELVTWDLECPNIRFKEKSTTYWLDPSQGTKKQALLDLSIKGGEPIAWSDERTGRGESREATLDEENSQGQGGHGVKAGASSKFSSSKPGKAPLISRQPSLRELIRSASTTSRAPSGSSDESTAAGSPKQDGTVQRVGSAIRGRGGSPFSGRSDKEALVGRLGRKQTCVINAAIMATSWPYKGKGGERYNKPIVVDVDLPVWTDAATLEKHGELILD